MFWVSLRDRAKRIWHCEWLGSTIGELRVWVRIPGIGMYLAEGRHPCRGSGGIVPVIFRSIWELFPAAGRVISSIKSQLLLCAHSRQTAFPTSADAQSRRVLP